MTEPALPPGFEALEPFVDRWAIEGSDARLRGRLSSDQDERLSFYETASRLLPQALEWLDLRDIDALGQQESTLLNLILSLAHVGLAVDQQGDSEAEHAIDHQHFVITRSTEDL